MCASLPTLFAYHQRHLLSFFMLSPSTLCFHDRSMPFPIPLDKSAVSYFALSPNSTRHLPSRCPAVLRNVSHVSWSGAPRPPSSPHPRHLKCCSFVCIVACRCPMAVPDQVVVQSYCMATVQGQNVFPVRFELAWKRARSSLSTVTTQPYRAE